MPSSDSQQLRFRLPSFKMHCTNSYRHLITSQLANTDLVLFAEHSGEHITKLWLAMCGLSEHDTELASRMFRLLSQWDLLLVDWSMSALVALADVDAVLQYLAEFRMADET